MQVFLQASTCEYMHEFDKPLPNKTWEFASIALLLRLFFLSV